jgi:HK97 gp10 family phage protein
MSLTITATGIDEQLARLNRLGDVAGNEVRKEVQRLANGIALTAKKSIAAHQSSGRVYEKENPKRTHTASKPNNPPNQDTGELGRSIVVIELDGGLGAYVGVPAGAMGDRAFKLEYGSGRVAQRPFMRPATKENEKLSRQRIDALAERLKNV